MNNYYPVIARAVERLDRSTGETRRTVYERAREAIAQLRSNQPALLDADIIKERLALEEAILKVEAGAARNLVMQTGAEPRWAAPSGDMSVGDKIQTGDHGQPASPDPDDRPPASSSRQAPVFSPTASDHWHNADVQAVAIGGAYGADHYYDDVPSSRWRGGFLVVMAVLALAVLAGSFAYRGMFGSSMFAALPPILKGVSRPDNFVRNNSDALRRNSSQTSVTSAGSGEKLPPIDIREAPKTMPRVISAIPISSKPSAGAIALAPAATTPALDPAVASALDQHVALSVSPPASAPVPVLASSEPNETAATAPATREQGAPTPALGPPVLTAVPVSPAASAPVPVQVSSEPTETAAAAPAAPTPVLRPPVLTALSAPPLLLASAAVPVQASSATKPAAAPAAREQGALSPALSLPVLTAASVPPPVSAPVPVLVSLEPPRETPAAPAPAIGLPVLTAASVPPPASAPMPIQVSSDSKKIELVSVEDGWGQTDTSSLAASAPNTATPAASAAAAPPVGNHGVQEDAAPSLSSGPPMQAAAAEVSSGGAYAVQLASESSAAEAHASFRALRSKFPNQLGGREPIVRRTDLGAKGVYYRVMVGPFASMEKAAGMCGTLKAAGCNCLVQRN